MESEKYPEPFWKENNVAIVFGISREYIYYLDVALMSLIENASSSYNYDIIIFSHELKIFEKKNLLTHVSTKNNISIRFFDPINSCCFSNLKNDWSIYSNFKFFVPWILQCYEKIIYLGADIIVKEDIGKLYHTKMDNKSFIAGVIDIGYIGRTQVDIKKTELNLKKPLEYINADVILFNLDKIRQNYSLSDFKEISKKKYRCYEQDAINVIYDTKKFLLDSRWNVFPDRGIDFNLYYQAPFSILEQWRKSLNNPFLIHYAGSQKPIFLKSKVMFFEQWWRYARKSVYYEDILTYGTWHNKKIGLSRRILDFIIPHNSIRRTILKKIYQKLKCQFKGDLSNIATVNKFSVFHVEPIFNNNFTALAMNSSEEYAPYLDVCLKSIASNSNSQHNYDLIIFDFYMTEITKTRLKSKYTKENFSVRFFDVSDSLLSFNSSINPNYSRYSYLKLLTPLIFSSYNKVIYSDIDVIFNCDIQEISEINIGKNPIGATRDYGLIIKSMNDFKTKEYLRKTKIKDVFNYYSAGLILFNINIAKKNVKKIKKKALKNHYYMQDVLNVYYGKKRKIYELPYCYLLNTRFIECNKELINNKKYYSDYLHGINTAKVYHYSGDKKPWIEKQNKYDDLWWEYAKYSDYYNTILEKYIIQKKRLFLVGLNQLNYELEKKLKFVFKQDKLFFLDLESFKNENLIRILEHGMIYEKSFRIFKYNKCIAVILDNEVEKTTVNNLLNIYCKNDSFHTYCTQNVKETSDTSLLLFGSTFSAV